MTEISTVSMIHFFFELLLIVNAFFGKYNYLNKKKHKHGHHYDFHVLDK